MIVKTNSRYLSIALRRLTSWTLGTSLLILSLPLGSPASVVAPPNLKTEAQIKSEAALYDNAMRAIEEIANMKLAVPEESRKAQAILDKQGPNLRFARSKLVALGLSDGTFASAVRARVPDKKAAEEFAEELAKDNKAILKLAGANSLADRMRASVAQDQAKLRRIAESLKRAADEIKSNAKTHHVIAPRTASGRSDPTLRSRLSVTEINDLSSVGQAPSGQDVALGIAFTVVILVVYVALLVSTPLSVALFVLAAPVVATVVAAVVVVAAISLIEKIAVNAGTEEGRDRVAACQKQNDKDLRNCLRDAENVPELFGARDAAKDLCYANWLVVAGVCLAA